MSCDPIRSELTAYHFASISDDTRRRVEVHLVACSACVRELVELKRAIEVGEDEPAPSAAARAKLRRAVARELGVAEAERSWAWWQRPAAFAFAASTVLAAMGAVRALTSGPGSPPHGLSSGARGGE